MDAKISVAAAVDRIGPHRIDLLRHHADIGFLAAVIGEAVVTQAVLQMTEQHDIVLERDVRTVMGPLQTDLRHRLVGGVPGVRQVVTDPDDRQHPAARRDDLPRVVQRGARVAAARPAPP